jgi:hypothetical protein
MCGFAASAPLADDLRGRMAMSGPVHRVLDDLKELPRHVGVGVVVDARGVNVRDLLIEQPLAGTDVSDAGEQFIEIGVAESPPCLDAFVVERETFDQKFRKPSSGPLAKRSAAGRTDSIADGQDHVEVVVQGSVLLAVGGSCQVFLDN